MAHPVTGVDHVVFLVQDLDDSARRFERLGFTLSPRGLHSPSAGTGNHTIIFRDDYLELLGVVAETLRNAGKRQTLAERGDSMTAIACRIGDVHGARSALSELGIATTEAIDVSRPLALPDGSSGMASFAVTAFSGNEVPKGEMFMCDHKNRDMVWRPELMSHANGAYAVAGIVVATEKPEDTARAYARLFAYGRIEDTGKGFTVTTGQRSAAIKCMAPDAVVVRYAGIDPAAVLSGDFAILQIAVADIAQTRSHLYAAGVAFHAAGDGGIFVSPVEAGGNVLEFL